MFYCFDGIWREVFFKERPSGAPPKISHSTPNPHHCARARATTPLGSCGRPEKWWDGPKHKEEDEKRNANDGRHAQRRRPGLEVVAAAVVTEVIEHKRHIWELGAGLERGRERARARARERAGERGRWVREKGGLGVGSNMGTGR